MHQQNAVVEGGRPTLPPPLHLCSVRANGLPITKKNCQDAQKCSHARHLSMPPRLQQCGRPLHARVSRAALYANASIASRVPKEFHRARSVPRVVIIRVTVCLLLSIALDKLATKWVAQSSRDPLILTG